MQNLIKFLKILSDNKILTIIKGHSCVVNLQELILTISTWLRSMHMQNLIKFHQFVHKILRGKQILTITKGHYCVVYLPKLNYNNLILNLVNINGYASGLIPSIFSQDIERKRNLDNDQRPLICCE